MRRKKARMLAAVLFLTGVVIAMWICGKWLRWRTVWQPAEYAESSGWLANRERGFYNMRGVMVSDENPADGALYESIACEERQETLELLQIHIGAYRDREISPSGIEQIEKTFEAYARKKQPVSLIVRVLYDWDGKGAQSDPASLALALRHMEQIGRVMEKYEDQIYIVQGVFVGSWAEMHSSRYLTEKSYRALLGQMDAVVPDSIFLAVRTPAFWRSGTGRTEPLSGQEAWGAAGLASRLSLFNDGILGNSLDCGTYGDVSREEAPSPGTKWIREDELAFQEQLNLYVPNGGEVVLDNPLNDLESADQALAAMHVSYLNRGHDTKVLEKWRNAIYRDSGSVYDGMSGYDYIERHLGYRFVIRDVSVPESGWLWEEQTITVRVENVGYSPRYTPCKVELILKNEDAGRTEIYNAGADVRQWVPGEEISFTVAAPARTEETGDWQVYLKVTGERDGMPLYFGNEGTQTEDGSFFLGTIRKRGDRR